MTLGGCGAVQTSKQPFRLNPMTSRERRIVHLALKEMPGVRTESVGVGEQRQVVIIRPTKNPPDALLRFRVLLTFNNFLTVLDPALRQHCLVGGETYSVGE